MYRLETVYPRPFCAVEGGDEESTEEDEGGELSVTVVVMVDSGCGGEAVVTSLPLPPSPC